MEEDVPLVRFIVKSLLLFVAADSSWHKWTTDGNISYLSDSLEVTYTLANNFPEGSEAPCHSNRCGNRSADRDQYSLGSLEDHWGWKGLNYIFVEEG